MKRKPLLAILCFALLFGSIIYAHKEVATTRNEAVTTQTEVAAAQKEVTVTQHKVVTAQNEVAAQSKVAIAQDEIAAAQYEEIVLTDETRYEPKLYQEPVARYAMGISTLTRSTYANLTLEEYLVNALRQFETDIDVSAYQIPKSEAGATFFQIVHNNPELFFVEKKISYYSNSATNTVTRYIVTYIDSEENIRKMQQEFEQAANLVLDQIDSSMTDLEKALVVHDYLALNCEYDYENYQNKTTPPASYNAYGALVKKTAVCDGYAGAYSYIMEDRLGIPCVIVSSEAMNHAWNMIYMDANWYHVDATWDDPTWDSIGRVRHFYFMLSDEAISDTEHKHNGWVTDYTASSNIYDTAFWSDINSAICYQQGMWHYSECNLSNRTVKLYRQSELLSGNQETLYTEEGLWNNYQNSYMYLAQARDKIYFNTRKSICRLDEDGTITTVYEPEISGTNLIFGFTIRGEDLCYALQETPNLNSLQKILRHNLPELHVPELEGISADDVETIYDGTAKKITINGTKPEDTVSYVGKDGIYDSRQPEMINAGTYQVFYKVERRGYQTYYGSAELVIAKAVPKYELPTGLQGNSGEVLGAITLPRGFTWQSDTDTELYREGTYTYYVTYEPEDDTNYETITDIEVKVTVICPEHEYTSQVTKEATETETGEETYTCRICGDTYTKDLPKKTTTINGISADDVQTTYDGTAKKITVNGTMQEDMVSYAGEDGVYGSQQPEMINAGTYQVLYKVERTGYQAYYGSAKVIITKAVPEYEVPANLQGSSGKTLETITLPRGFTWQSNADTKLFQEGTYTYYVTYEPENSTNYETVKNIMVTVVVKCPKHQYTSQVTKQPTETAKGQKTYTCKICGDTYTEDIAMLTPEQTGNSELPGNSDLPGNLTGFKVTKATATSLTFSWNKETGVNYHLVLYKGNQQVSVIDTENNSYTYSNLKGATVYTLKVTPYRQVNGQKIYANSTASIQTATAPAKVTKISIKKKGASKGKVTWKKVTGASGYEIYLKTGKEKYKKVKTITRGNTVSYIQKRLKKGKTYYFKIRAYKSVGKQKVYGVYTAKKIKFSGV